MKAVVLYGVDDIRYISVAEPRPERGELLLKVKAATVCGTDFRILHGKKTAGIRYPSIIGHEFAGVVADNGGNNQFKLGQAVTGGVRAYPEPVCTRFELDCRR